MLTLRVKLFAQREEMPVDLALGVHVGPSVGSGMALAREPRALPSLMVGRQFHRLRAALDAGLLLRPRTILSPDKHIQDELDHALRLGGTLSTLGSGLRGELALMGSVPLYRGGAFIEALAGARLPVSASVEAYAMAGEEDACPLVPGIPEMHGCPAQDTVLDHLDNCPDAAGPPANQGCPEEEKQLVAIQRARIEIRDTVHFNFDKATISPGKAWPASAWRPGASVRIAPSRPTPPTRGARPTGAWTS
ncbi:hypothetical protein [Hyalangium minutum]|uniref:Flagellar motor rotation protein MotB n=1 Tax=Hyalangium minutum TaxID=394096 RepID=A0A085WV61_9BACT|nr:hypothetical protein [Hyalangium minutum]KFE71574.1 Flagellar motor rotation protein MotB [Hyalangium minutum]